MVAFVWMAVTAYDVDKQEIQVFAIFSVILLALAIVAGLVFSIVLFLIRRGRDSEGLLGKIETIERETANQTEANMPPEEKSSGG